MILQLYTFHKTQTNSKGLKEYKTNFHPKTYDGKKH